MNIKVKEIKNCLHFAIKVIDNGDNVECIKCKKQLSYITWETDYFSSKYTEVEYLKKHFEKNNSTLNDECIHPMVSSSRSIIDADGRIVSGCICETCNKVMSAEEWRLSRVYVSVEKDFYHNFGKNTLINLVIALRDKLEEAHKKLEITSEYVIGNDDDEEFTQVEIPLHERDKMDDGISNRDIMIHILKERLNERR